MAEGDGIIEAMTNPDEQTSTPSLHVVPTYDALLEMLVRLAHKHGIEVGVTLNMPGAVMSGLLVSRERWLDALADAQESGTSAHALLDALRDVGLRAETIRNPPADEEPFNFIHLRHTRLLDGAGVAPAGDGVFWRGRLSEVAGWAFGNVSP